MCGPFASRPTRNQFRVARSVPKRCGLLFPGNTGYDGHWLQVVGAASMKHVSWNELNDEVTYQIQLATDASFNDIVLYLPEVAETTIEPNLPPGFYYFRIGATDLSGNVGPWSDTGTLERVADTEPPIAAILSALLEGQILTLELEVSDDTVLRLAQFSINGEYVGSLGLKTENYKVVPSFGIPRTVVFESEIPKKGSNRSPQVTADVGDVVDKFTTVVSYVPEPGELPTLCAVGIALGFLKLMRRRRAR